MIPEDTAPRTTRSLMTSGPFARFFWAALVGSTGDWVTVFAMITIAGRIGSQEGILIALMSRILPGLLLGGLVGVVSDRMDRRKLVVFADVGRGIVVPFMMFVDSLPMLVGLTLILELLSLLGQPPRTAMVPRLVRAENLVSANSLMLAAAYGTVPIGSLLLLMVAGFPDVSLGGLVPAANQGLVIAFVLDAVTFFASGLLIASLPKIIAPLAEENGNGTVDLKSTWKDFKEGMSFLAGDPSVRRVIIGMTTALFGGGAVIVLGQDFVGNVLNADQAGFYAIITMLGVGAVAGLALRIDKRIPLGASGYRLWSGHNPDRPRSFCGRDGYDCSRGGGVDGGDGLWCWSRLSDGPHPSPRVRRRRDARSGLRDVVLLDAYWPVCGHGSGGASWSTRFRWVDFGRLDDPTRVVSLPWRSDDLDVGPGGLACAAIGFRTPTLGQ